MLDLVTTTQFRKDLKRLRKRGADLRRLDAVLQLLLAEQALPKKHRDHALTGDCIGFRECHVMPDWLLIYAVDRGRLILTASRTGTHADLF
ncbi:type II toxin-antitoxin system YafQ family toxin [Selenomonas noxia]|jgi:addiction module toxin, relE/stbE family|uniref:type II toxin-antitoxin system YafQ family toxin n=1 Tax=Selenomonas noxia TaxID=135083 RepID=UPI002359AB85|nr:type II toxin-antitoxin system YafQ family toxin [Selenomonas noxia]